MKEGEQDFVNISRDRGRETKFGYSSQQMLQVDRVFYDLVVVHKLSMQAFVTVMQRFPFMREQTKLIEQVFKHVDLVQDMIAFLLQPHNMIQKYKITQELASRFVKSIAFFIKENFQFYEFYFLSLEDNSSFVEERSLSESDGELMRMIIDPTKSTLDQWFNFLENTSIDPNEFDTIMGYFTEIFLPFIKYQYSISSRVNDYYELKYKKEISILLIPHFQKSLVNKIMKYTHHSSIFKCLFSLVVVSLGQQEWKYSLCMLSKLCESVVIKGMTSDLHIENLYNMVKEVADNISNDKNRTVFAFVSAIIKSNIVQAALSRLICFIKSDEEEKIQKFESDWIIEMNLKLLVEIIHIYYLLIKSGIDKNANKMKQLRHNIIQIQDNFDKLILLVKKIQVSTLNFSNGEILKSTPLFKYQFFNLIKMFLIFGRDNTQHDNEIRIDAHFSEIIALIQISLSENRWNSIMHSLLEKIIGMIITTQFFKTKNNSLNNFLDFLMESFTNKKYVFLNSTRMANQGDIQSLYNISRKITISFQKASISFGLNNQYEEWRSFVVNVLQKFQNNIERSSNIQYDDIEESVATHQEIKAFSVQIDQVASIKQIVNRIDIRQKWSKKDLNNSKTLYRSGSFENLELPKTSKNLQSKRDFGGSPIGKPRGSVQEEKISKSVYSQFKCDRKLSNSTGFIKQQVPQGPITELRLSSLHEVFEKSYSGEKQSKISESDKRKSKKTKEFQLQASNPQ